MLEASHCFTALDIDGYEIVEFSMKTREILSLHLSKLNLDEDKSISSQLEFLNVHDCFIRVSGRPFFESVAGHRAMSDISKYPNRESIQELLEGNDDRWCHFQIAFNGGCFDIIAENFKFCIFKKLDVVYPDGKK